MKLRHPQDLLAAGLFLAAGFGFLWASQDYDLGTARSMGPAFFPGLLAVLQILLGFLVMGLAFWDKATPQEPLSPTDWRGLLLICGSVLLFGQGLPVLGFVVAGPLLVILSSLASKETTWRERLLLAVGLTAFCVLVFRIGLDMRFPLFPVFLTN